MDTKLQSQLTSFTHGSVPYVIVRRSELPSAAAYLAIAGVAPYHVEPIVLDGEEWYQLSLATEPLWQSPPPTQDTACK